MNAPEHPLWPFIRTMNASTGPSGEELRLRAVELRESLAMPPNPKHDRPQSLAELPRDYAWHLLLAMEGEDCRDRYKWLELFRFVTSTPFGVAVGDAAVVAMRSGIFIPAFRESLRFPEFPKAVLVWLASIGARKRIGCSAEDYLSNAWDEETQEFFLALHAKQTGDAAEALAILKRKKAKDRQTKSRAKKQTPKVILSKMVNQWWIPAALWCRTPGGVVEFFPRIFPKNAKGACEAVMHAWEGLEKSRCVDREPQIDAAEERSRRR